MKKVHLGMFIEINKDRLSVEDMCHAVNALENSTDEKVYSLLYRDTKNPKFASFLACFFGWLGLDCFYLGNVLNGIGRILFTALCIGLGFVCHNFIDLVSPILSGDLLKYIDYMHVVLALLLSATYPIYISYLIRHSLTKSTEETHKKNAKIFHLKCKEYQWSIK